MARDIDRAPATAYDDANRAGFRAFNGLWRLVHGKFADYEFNGISVKRNPGGYLVVVRAFDHHDKRSCVCFGSGPDWFSALRNGSLAVAKGSWKADKWGWP